MRTVARAEHWEGKTQVMGESLGVGSLAVTQRSGRPTGWERANHAEHSRKGVPGGGDIRCKGSTEKSLQVPEEKGGLEAGLDCLALQGDEAVTAGRGLRSSAGRGPGMCED